MVSRIEDVVAATTMEAERHYFGVLDGVQRQGQGVLDCLTSVAQGLGGLFQSHIPTIPPLPFPSEITFSLSLPSPQLQLPWSSPIDYLMTGSDMKLSHPLNIGLGFPEALSMQHLGHDVSSHVEQAGATIGAYLSDLAGGLMQRFPGPADLKPEDSSSLHHYGVSSTLIPAPSFHVDATEEDIVEKELVPRRGNNSRSSAFVSTTFSSRTEDVETSVIARGDLWRVEATQGGTSTPLFLLQFGPILFVRASTLLLPIHLSKRHCLWYGFDRKEGSHSLCPAVWSKHRRWLAMAMLSLNPVACSFLDLQFPNGQMTYVAGDGLTGSAFTTTLGGLLQVQGRFPGSTKISYSCKNKYGTRFTPAILLPERSACLEIVQPLAWQPLGVLVRPTVELSVIPTIGGRHPGMRVEVMHSPVEKFSWGCGCVQSVDSKAFASVSVGRSKRNGEQVGSCGLTLQVESPVSNPRRASFTVQLNSGIEI